MTASRETSAGSEGDAGDAGSDFGDGTVAAFSCARTEGSGNVAGESCGDVAALGSITADVTVEGEFAATLDALAGGSFVAVAFGAADALLAPGFGVEEPGLGLVISPPDWFPPCAGVVAGTVEFAALCGNCGALPAVPGKRMLCSIPEEDPARVSATCD